MKRLERQKEAAEALSRYVVICWTSSIGRRRSGAVGVCLMVVSEVEMSLSCSDSKLVLGVRVSDAELVVEVRDFEELELRVRRKRPMLSCLVQVLPHTT